VTNMAEVHIVGQLVGASDFPLPNIFVKYSFEAGSNFRLLQGHTAGQTHCDMPQVCADLPSFFGCLPTPHCHTAGVLTAFLAVPAAADHAARMLYRKGRWRYLPTRSMSTTR
jgi:hypothetical protein